MAKKTKTRVKVTVKKKRSNSSLFALKLTGISIVLIFLIKHSFIFLIAGMLPAIVAHLIDRTDIMYKFKVVAAMNFAGVAPHLSQLQSQNHSADAVRSIMADPMVWMVMYGSAALGWALVFLAPMITRATIEFFSDNKVARLELEQHKLEEEWGPEIGGMYSSREGPEIE